MQTFAFLQEPVPLETRLKQLLKGTGEKTACVTENTETAQLKLKALLEKIAQGDEFSFSRLFDLYHPRLYRFALYMTGSPELSEEAVSDVFFKIWKKRASLTDIRKPEQYLFTSVKNQAWSALKKASGRKDRNISLEDYQGALQVDHQHPERSLLDKELALKIRHAIQQLPPKCKMIFCMIREEGLKYRQVAELLDISEKTVENQMLIAVKRLKKALR